MAEPDERKDHLSRELMRAFFGTNATRIEQLLAEGADPLSKVTYMQGFPAVCPLENAFDKTFNQPFDCQLDYLDKYARCTIILLRAVKGTIPAELVAIAAEKPPVPMSHHDGTLKIPVSKRTHYEHDGGGSVLNDVRAMLSYHVIKGLAITHGKLSYPKDSPKRSIERGYYWPENVAENALGNKVLELLAKSWCNEETWQRILTDSEIWRSPEDALAYATLSGKEYAGYYKSELSPPITLFRALNDPGAGSHLGRYLSREVADRGRHE